MADIFGAFGGSIKVRIKNGGGPQVMIIDLFCHAICAGNVGAQTAEAKNKEKDQEDPERQLQPGVKPILRRFCTAG